jgi:hypothetical protein
MGITLLSWGLPWDGRAAEWSAEPSIGVKGVYNSNLLLVVGPQKSVYGNWVSPAVKFAGSVENLEVSGRAAADFVQYYGGGNQTFTNLFFPLSVKYKIDREFLNLEGGYTRDNTLMGELLQTGVALRFTQRNLLNLSPSWTHMLTEKLSVQAGYQYANATYEDGLSLGLVDYTTQGGSGNLSYKLTEYDQVQVIGTYTNFSAPQANDLQSEIYGGMLSLSHEFSETMTASLSAGPRFVTSTQAIAGSTVSGSQTVGVGSVTLRKNWDDAFVQLDAGREINPSGFGFLLQTDRFGVTLSKNASERLTASVNAVVLLASSIATTDQSTPFPDNRFVNVTPRLTWKLDQWWAVDVTYTYGRRDVESFNQYAISNAATVMLTYYPQKFTVGR